MTASLGLTSAQTVPTSAQARGVNHVVVVGAGAAGLTAGYRLWQRGVDFTIVEASRTHGGRMKRDLRFADFPLPLGAEWLHTSPGVFAEIVADPSRPVRIDTVGYTDNDVYAFWDGRRLSRSGLGDDTDLKFVGSSWLDFFEGHILPPVRDRMLFGREVIQIRTDKDAVVVETRSGEQHSGDAVIVTVSLGMLQRGAITFVPPLPDTKTRAIADATFWAGYKAFLEFDEAFYPAYTEVGVEPETAGRLGFYDAAHGQDTALKVLGLFAVGRPALAYSGLTEAAAADRILQQLDQIFDGRATPGFRRIITQDWTNEPFVHGAYIHDDEDWRIVRDLGQSAGPRLHFAGEAYTSGEDWGSVHAAALAAKRVVDRL